ncbi:metal-dependent hydrolase [Candidatus Uhrbacteria bacterium]|nr:metal-dependent hydrolase [Candidatus Uhrbacteria bacterium]
MLFPGHAAAGYLVGVGIVALTASHPDSTSMFLWIGAVCGAMPDIDMFAAFARTRSLVIENEKQSHRAYITHTPLFWAVMAFFMFLASRNALFALIVLLAPLSHLFLDSLEDEIQWLGPWSKKGYRIFKSRKDLAVPRHDFFSFWGKFLFWYWTNRRLTAALEIALIVSALLTGFLAIR